jgi:hypothetical protein
MPQLYLHAADVVCVVRHGHRLQEHVSCINLSDASTSMPFVCCAFCCAVVYIQENSTTVVVVTESCCDKTGAGCFYATLLF